jgi:hypothetical protein
MAREPARPEQVEEDRAAAQERLEVAAELRWIEPPERRQQLTLSAGPLEERTANAAVRHHYKLARYFSVSGTCSSAFGCSSSM